MFLKTPERSHQGFLPAALSPQDTIHPEISKTHRCSFNQGGKGAKTGLSVIVPVLHIPYP
jgi:hypothetical protein